MAKRTGPTQSQITQYLRATHLAGYVSGQVEILRPDGTRVKIKGETERASIEDSLDSLIDAIPDVGGEA